jgi:hypothetical protein
MFGLQARLAASLAERDAAIAECDQARSHNVRLQHLLNQCKHPAWTTAELYYRVAVDFEEVAEVFDTEQGKGHGSVPGAPDRRQINPSSGSVSAGAKIPHLKRPNGSVAPE